MHPWLPSAPDYKKSDKLEFVSSKFSKCWSFLSCKITCLGSTLLHSISDDELFFKKGYTFHINSYFGKGKMSRVQGLGQGFQGLAQYSRINWIDAGFANDFVCTLKNCCMTAENLRWGHWLQFPRHHMLTCCNAKLQTSTHITTT